MHRRTFLRWSSAAAAAGFWVRPGEALYQPKPEARGALDSPPVLQSPAPDGVTVAIAVSTVSTAWVEYGTTPALGSKADGGEHGLLPLSGRVHRIRLESLRPGTRYHYRVGICPIDFKSAYTVTRKPAAFTGTYSFSTLDAGNGDAASFAVINDTHETPPTLQGVMTALAKRSSDLVFWSGDIFNEIRSDAQIVEQVLRPAGSDYAASTPLCFVSGNHDVRGIHARALSRFVDVPRGRRHYVLRQGPVAFIVLDTGEDKPDTDAVYAGLCGFGAYRVRQREWLEQALASEEVRSAPFRIGMLHIPLWGKACSEDSRRQWHGLLAKAGVQATISGHVHEYKFTPPQTDHPYAQLVAGGPKPEAATVIEGHADGRELTLIVRSLDGRELGNHPIRA